MYAAVLFAALPSVAVRAGPLPNDLRAELLYPKHAVHQHLEVVPGCGVAVQVDGARGLEDAAQLHKARRHHHEVGHHRVTAQELAQGRDHVLDAGRSVAVEYDLVLVGALRFQRPVPGVGERPDLRRRLLAGLLPEQHVVVGVGIEGRVEVDEIDRLVGEVLSHDAQIVAVVECVGHGSCAFLNRCAAPKV